MTTPPHDIPPLTAQKIQIWRLWALRKDGGEGSRGHLRQATINAIFDAALVGTGLVKEAREDYCKTTAARLRQLADAIEMEPGDWSE